MNYSERTYIPEKYRRTYTVFKYNDVSVRFGSLEYHRQTTLNLTSNRQAVLL